jgi:hypothetical protein
MVTLSKTISTTTMGKAKTLIPFALLPTLKLLMHISNKKEQQ